MKVDRRSFLSFIIGGAAGTVLSPLPLKLTDDLAIWTQNWPWTPVPVDGESNYVNSACTLCPGGCGISVRRVDERSIKIEGIKEHPVNEGGICSHGLSGLQLLYDEKRVKSPLKRIGKRGEGKWEAVSWKNAIDEVVKNLKKLRAVGKSDTVASITGTNFGTVNNLIKRFLTAYGSPNFMVNPSIMDTYELAIESMHGTKTLPCFDFANADLILSFGAGLLDGWGSPVSMLKLNSVWKNRKADLIQIEPRLSNTAAKFDKWIPINPGTEAVLALGMANVIINGSMYNKNFVENYSNGFNEFKNLVSAEYTPDKVAEITGIKRSTIISLAKKFIKAARPIAVSGRGKGQIPGNLNEFLAVHALNALAGNINKKGGVTALSPADYIKWPDVAMDSAAEKGFNKKRIDEAGSDKYTFASSLLNRLPEVLETSNKELLNILFIAGTNPLYSMPDNKALKQAFEKIPMIISFSSYMDETALNADLILPNHSYLERYEDVLSSAGMQKNVISLVQPITDPLFNTKNTGDIFIEMAKQMGGKITESFKWNSYETCLNETFGNKWDLLMEQGFLIPEKPNKISHSFKTASGKFEFPNTDRALFPAPCLINIEGDAKSYPLILIPYDSMRLASGYTGDTPFAIKTVEDSVLRGKDSLIEINPVTASTLGFADREYAVLKTPKGKARVKINLFEGIMPGIIALPTGLGHTAGGRFLDGKGVNVNELIGTVEDPVSGLNAAWGIRASLGKA